MNRMVIIVLAAVVLIGVFISWMSRDAANVETTNTPTDRQEIPVPGGTEGVPVERQNPAAPNNAPTPP